MGYIQMQNHQPTHNSAIYSYTSDRIIALSTVVVVTLLIEGISVFASIVFHLFPLVVFASFWPLLAVVPVGEIMIVGPFIATASRRAIANYVDITRQNLEWYASVYTPLKMYAGVYGRVDTSSADVTQPATPTLRELTERHNSHLLLLGTHGSGKTITLHTHQHALLSSDHEVIRGKGKIPLYIALSEYNTFLREEEQEQVESPADNSTVHSVTKLVDYICSKSEELKTLRPYIYELFKRGRILLLCDDIDRVETPFLPVLCEEIIDFMNSENIIFITCDENFYRDQPLMTTLVTDTDLKEVVIAPLATSQIAEFVDTYHSVNEVHLASSTWAYTVHEIIAMIDTLLLRDECTNPSFLFLLIETLISRVREKREQVTTRGLLLKQMIAKQLEEGLGKLEYKREGVDIKEDDVRVLLCLIAGVTRRKQPEEGIIEDAPVGEDLLRPRRTYRELAVQLENELLDLSVDETSLNAEDDPSLMLPSFSELQIAHMLKFAEAIALITISPRSLLRFKYRAFEEFFAADYLQRLDEVFKQDSLPIEGELFTNTQKWLKSVRIWSALLADPTRLENRIARVGRSNASYAEAALTLGIISVDARLERIPSLSMQEYVLPKSLEELFKQLLTSTDGITTLARIFTRCAREDGVQVYRFLLPHITLEPVDELFCKLDKQAIANLLFSYLPEAIKKSQFGVEPLMRSILGRLGSCVIPLATDACKPVAGLSGTAFNEHVTLRKTAIAVLGRIEEPRAVEVLLHYLREDSEIGKEASSALIRIGPALALKPILEEATITRASNSQQLALSVIEGFLKLSRSDETQYQSILNTLLLLLSSEYEIPVQQRAKGFLIQEVLQNKEQSEFVIKLMIFKYLLPDIDMHQMLNIQAALQQIGGIATPALLLNLKHPAEISALRLIQIIAKVRDKAAIPTLLTHIVAPWATVKDLIAKTLVEYASDSVPPLVRLILSTKHTDQEARVASSILKDIGDVSTIYIVQHILPIVPQRTQLLVQVLASTHDKRALEPLLKLLQIAREDAAIPLALEVVYALSRIPDKRSVTPLLNMLTFPGTEASPYPFYAAVNKTLSLFNTEGLHELIAALDSEQETNITRGVRDALFLMQPFPQQSLLQVFEIGSVAHAMQVVQVFRAKGTDVAHFLVGQLCHPNKRTQQFVERTLDQMEEKQILSALLEAQHTACRPKIAPYLRNYAHASMPRLVDFLSSDDVQRSNAATLTLIEFGPMVLPALAVSLNQPKNNAHQRSQQIIEKLVRQNVTILPQVFALFRSLSAQNEQFGANALLSVLTNHLAEISTPALITGLGVEDPLILRGIVDALARLIQKKNTHSVLILQQIHTAFVNEGQRMGAAFVLEGTGEMAVPTAVQLTNHENVIIRQEACEVLSKIGTPALPVVLMFISTPAKRDMGERILHGMKTTVVFDYLVDLLGSQKPDEVENALTLLLGRVRTDADIPSRSLDGEQEIIPALLEHVQTRARSSVHLRIIAFLLLLDKNTVLRALNQVLAKPPYPPSWLEWLMPLFLVLNMEGVEARTTLLKIAQNPTLSHKLNNEVISILGMIEPNEMVEKHAISLVNQVYAPVRTAWTQTSDHTELALRALGGLLVKGKWNSNTLQDRRGNVANETNEHELYSVLLGDAYAPRITALRKQLSDEQTARTQEAQMHEKKLESLRIEVEQWKQRYNTTNGELTTTQGQLTNARSKLKLAETAKANLQVENQSLTEFNQRIQRKYNDLHNRSNMRI